MKENTKGISIIVFLLWASARNFPLFFPALFDLFNNSKKSYSLYSTSLGFISLFFSTLVLSLIYLS